MTADLAATIDAAWEDARPAQPPRRTGPVREAVETALAMLDDGTAARRRARARTAAGRSTSGSRRRCCCPSGSATTSSSPMARAARAAFDKVQSKFDGWTAETLPRRGLPRRARRDRPPRRVHRQGRGADAELRQHRRLCRRGHDGRHLGDGRLVRADRQERPSLGRRRDRRRARAAAGRTRW